MKRVLFFKLTHLKQNTPRNFLAILLRDDCFHSLCQKGDYLQVHSGTISLSLE